jgi:hypothetical protein
MVLTRGGRNCLGIGAILDVSTNDADDTRRVEQHLRKQDRASGEKTLT